VVSRKVVLDIKVWATSIVYESYGEFTYLWYD